MNAGDKATISKVASLEDILLMVEVSMVHKPAHMNGEFASGTIFGARVRHGLWSAGLISAILGTRLSSPGTFF